MRDDLAEKKYFAISLNFGFADAASLRKSKQVCSSLSFRNFGFADAASLRKSKQVCSSLSFRNFDFALIMAPWKRKFIFFSLGLRNFRIFGLRRRYFISDMSKKILPYRSTFVSLHF